MKIPYGIAEYDSLIEKGYYYVDKTRFIEELESLSTLYPVLLRPRRMGKTLLVTTLESYYDINEAERFDKLFSDTYIGKHKTELANSYYILRFDFSGLNTENVEKLEKSFYNEIQVAVKRFIDKYNPQMEVPANDDGNSYFKVFLNNLYGSMQKKVYVIIDEYDHFANEFLSSEKEFKEITGKDGFVRGFYEILKRFCTNKCIDRIFITGVTSLTLDSLTSGFNIAKNVSMYPKLNEILGFNYEETKALLEASGMQHIDEKMSLLEENYNGYCFSPKAHGSVFNSNMVLYFVDEYLMQEDYPDILTDPNILSDYRKLTSMFDLFKDEKEREYILEKMMLNEELEGRLITSFALGTGFDTDHFISLLYYLGLLTIAADAGEGNYYFKIPNAVISSVYYDYFYQYLKERFNISNVQISEAL